MDIYRITTVDYSINAEKIYKEFFITVEDAKVWLKSNPAVQPFAEKLINNEESIEGCINECTYFAEKIYGEIKRKTTIGSKVAYQNYAKVDKYFIDFLYFKHNGRYLRMAKFTVLNLQFKFSKKYVFPKELISLKETYKFQCYIEDDNKNYKNRLTSHVFLLEKEFKTEEAFEYDYLTPSAADTNVLFIDII